MALADGRLVPHGRHADLHRRAINAMENKPPRKLRVKWFPSHMEEEHIRAGIMSRESRCMRSPKNW
eukprot:12579825-Heterocapsa_arctica.AAC.1